MTTDAFDQAMVTGAHSKAACATLRRRCFSVSKVVLCGVRVALRRALAWEMLRGRCFGVPSVICVAFRLRFAALIEACRQSAAEERGLWLCRVNADRWGR